LTHDTLEEHKLFILDEQLITFILSELSKGQESKYCIKLSGILFGTFFKVIIFDNKLYIYIFVLYVLVHSLIIIQYLKINKYLCVVNNNIIYLIF